MFFSSTKRSEVILVLDVQSSVVRGTIMKIESGKSPLVLYSHNSAITFKPHTDSSYLIKVTLKAVEETVREASKFVASYKSDDERIKISEIHFALYSPWIISQAKTLSMSFEKPTLITKAFVKKIIDTERAKLTPNALGEVRAIEEKIFDVKLNGYSVSEWDEKTANSVQISYTLSVAGARMIEKFVYACGSAVKDKHIHFHSGLLLQHIGYSSINSHHGNYAMVHIHGELTDILISKDGSCVFFGSYPIGVRTIIRKIAASMTVDEQSAESSLTLHTGGHLDDAHRRNEMHSITNISNGWIAEFDKMISETKDEIHISSFVISAWSHDDFFAGILRLANPSSEVNILSMEELLPHVAFYQNAERRRLTGLYAVALSIMRNK